MAPIAVRLPRAIRFPVGAELRKLCQIVLTRATDGTTDAYIDGTLAFSFNDSDGQAIIGNGMLQQFLDFLIDDNANTVPFIRENEGGFVARIRLYDGVLTPTEIANLDEVPEPASGLLLASAGTFLLGRRRRSLTKKSFAPIAPFGRLMVGKTHLMRRADMTTQSTVAAEDSAFVAMAEFLDHDGKVPSQPFDLFFLPPLEIGKILSARSSLHAVGKRPL